MGVLADKANKTMQSHGCRATAAFKQAFEADGLDADDRAVLAVMLDDEQYTATGVEAALASIGVTLNRMTVKRHRSKRCDCEKGNN